MRFVGRVLMPHVVEPAASARAKCRGCDEKIAKGELRFGERMPNLYGEGEMTLWFHLVCGAYRRPESLLEVLETPGSGVDAIPDPERIRARAEASLAHRRIPRLGRAERAASGRARCRSCREAIAKGAWRIALLYYQEGRFEPAGFIHVRCVRTYCETTDLLERIHHFTPDLTVDDAAEVHDELAGEA